MQPKYKFSDNYLGFSDTHIHVLRNRFEVKKIPYVKIAQVRIYRGRAINNWALLLFIGILMFAGGVFYSLRVFQFMTGQEGTVYVEGFLLLFLAFFFGGLLIYKALRKEAIIELEHEEGNHRTSASHFIKQSELEDLVAHLSARTNVNREI